MSPRRIRRFVGKRLVAVTVLVGAATLAGSFAEHHWLADHASQFSPHLLAIGALACVGLAACARPRWALVAGALAAVLAVRLLPYWQASIPAGGASTERVRLVQWNVNRSNERIREAAAWLQPRLAGIDVLALLEVTPAWHLPLEVIAGEFPYAQLVMRSDNFGIAVFSRLAGTEMELRYYAGIDLPSVEVRGTTPGGTSLRVLATHPGPPLGRLLWQARNAQLRDLAADVARDPQATVVLGDLNVTRFSPWLDLLTGHGLRDAQEGFGYAPTWAPAALPLWLGLPIDHTLVPAGFGVTRRELGPRLGSDHRVVITDIVPSTPSAPPARRQ